MKVNYTADKNKDNSVDSKKRFHANFSSKQKKRIHSQLYTNKLVNYLDTISKRCFTKIGDLSIRGYYSSTPLSFENKTLGDLLNLELGSKWAKSCYDCMWFKLEGKAPEGVDVDDVAFSIDVGGMGIVVDNYGVPIQSISSNISEYNYNIPSFNNKIVFNHNFINHDRISFWVDLTANYLYDNPSKSRIQELSICKINRQFLNLYFDLQVLIAVYNYADCNYALRIENLLDKLKIYNLETIDEKEAKQISDILTQILDNKNSGDMFTLSSVGYTHINVAKMLPIRESIRMASRVFANQLRYIGSYPEYITGSSQAQVYKWMHEKYPELYKQIKQAILDNRWELLGSTWVEMDTNLIGAESLIRQIYYAKKYFSKEFGKEPQIMWLPDSYGFSPCLPEVMRQSNIPYFLTSILSENKNKIPYNTFNWKGIDGSTVLTHILPEGTYSGSMKANDIELAMSNYHEKAKHSNALLTFGTAIGASFEHLERAIRQQNVKPLPRVKMEKAIDFFDRTNKINHKFEIYDKELYLEKYQGSYSSRYIAKWYNRKIEYALRNYELLLVQLGLTDSDNIPISNEELDSMWQELLTYQSHDILTGASIDSVYEGIYIRYDVIYNKLIYSIGELLNYAKQGEIFYNPNSFDYEYIYKFQDKWYCQEIPQFSVVKKDNGKEITAYYGIAGDDYIENKMYKLTFKNGEIVSLYDKFYNKEFVPEGLSMASFNVYTDKGDMLNLDSNYINSKHRLTCKSFETKKDGPVISAVAVFTTHNIRVEETISIVDGLEGVKIGLKVGIYSKNKMLRVNFATNIETKECSYNTQFGHIKRSTLDKSSIEKQAFEVPSQKFVDLSNSMYGVSFINDSRYGFRCKNGNVSMCLARTPGGNKIDFGNFEVNMKILPHHSSMDSNTYKQAYLVNNPIIEAVGYKKQNLKKISVDNQNIVIESVKQALKGGTIIRIYNSSEEPQTANIMFGRRTTSKIVDIMENIIDDNRGAITLQPFKFVSLYFD